MRSVILLLGVLITLSVASSTANACTCAGTKSACDSFGSASAVFVGTAVSVRETSRPNTDNPREINWTPIAVKFSVEQSYLGVPGTEAEVFTGQGGGDCGYVFQVGQRYLVYAYEYEKKFSTSICSRTKPFSNATEDLAFLGTLATRSRGVTISGQVIREDDKPIGADVSIKLEGEAERKEIRPDAKGSFSVSGLRAGKYKISIVLPETLTTYQPEREITVSDRGCASIVWHLGDNGRVVGRVIDADNGLVARILVSLLNPDDPKEHYVKAERTDRDGQFIFSGVAPGRYIIAINLNRYPDPQDSTNAYPPAFYPGVIDKAQAQVINLGAGEKISDLEVRIPSRRPPSVLNGSVVWADGSPVSKAELSVYDVTQGGTNTSFGISTDDQGNFKIEGFVGQKLIINARSNRPYPPGSNRFEPMERSEKVSITLQRPTKSLRIVITKLQ